MLLSSFSNHDIIYIGRFMNMKSGLCFSVPTVTFSYRNQESVNKLFNMKCAYHIIFTKTENNYALFVPFFVKRNSGM